MSTPSPPPRGGDVPGDVVHRRRDICRTRRAPTPPSGASACACRDRTTPKTSVSSTHNKSLVCTSVRWNDAYAVMRPVLRLVVEKTGEVIIGGIMTYSGESKICSTSRPVRKTAEIVVRCLE